MASSFKLTLDTLAPTNPNFEIFGAPVTSEQDVSVVLTHEDPEPPFAGYQVKIWGDVDLADNEDIQDTEEKSKWINWSSSENLAEYAVKLSEGDGAKKLHAKIRDDVWNETSQLNAEIELNTTIPVITISAGPSPAKISKVATKNLSTFTFKANEKLMAWKVEVVENESDGEGTGTVIEENEGSEHTEGGTLNAETNQTVKISGQDLQAVTGEDGDFTIKVFGQSQLTGLWSA